MSSRSLASKATMSSRSLASKATMSSRNSPLRTAMSSRSLASRATMSSRNSPLSATMSSRNSPLRAPISVPRRVRSAPISPRSTLLTLRWRPARATPMPSIAIISPLIRPLPSPKERPRTLVCSLSFLSFHCGTPASMRRRPVPSRRSEKHAPRGVEAHSPNSEHLRWAVECLVGRPSVPNLIASREIPPLQTTVYPTGSGQASPRGWPGCCPRAPCKPYPGPSVKLGATRARVACSRSYA